jgi:hypothetical protein
MWSFLVGMHFRGTTSHSQTLLLETQRGVKMKTISRPVSEGSQTFGHLIVQAYKGAGRPIGMFRTIDEAERAIKKDASITDRLQRLNLDGMRQTIS